MKYIFAVVRETAWAEDHMRIEFLVEKFVDIDFSILYLLKLHR